MLPESVITTAVLIGALKPVERWQAMRNFHQNNNFMLDRRFIFIELAVIVILAVLLFWMNYRQRRSEARGVTSAFNSFARRSGLSGEEINLVLLLADAAEFKQPDMIFISVAAFDKGAAMLLAEQTDDNEQHELAVKLSLLRRKLGFSIQETALQGTSKHGSSLSSRQIPIGKILQITRRKTSISMRLESRLIRSEDMSFTVELNEVLKIVPDEVWNLQYNLGPSVWEFDARLVNAHERELTFGHSEDVRFISRRRFLRVDVSREAYISLFAFEAGEKMCLPRFVNGNLREIAGPGLLIEAPLQTRPGDRVLVIAQAADDIVVQDIGIVRHIKPAEKGNNNIAVELTGLTEANVDEMVRLTNMAAMSHRTREPVKVG